MASREFDRLLSVLVGVLDSHPVVTEPLLE
jgi:hypothetical protein